MHQRDLFEPPAIWWQETSVSAADAIRDSAATLRLKVLGLLRERGPMTDEQIQERLSMNPSTERPRRIELVMMGLVHDSGCTDRTRSGRKAIVWASRAPEECR